MSEQLHKWRSGSSVFSLHGWMRALVGPGLILFGPENSSFRQLSGVVAQINKKFRV